jgi:hypothetical protein
MAMRSIPRIAAEPFMRVVGEMLDLEEEAADDEVIDADLTPITGAAPIHAAGLPADHRAMPVEQPPTGNGTAASESASGSPPVGRPDASRQ